MAYAKKQKTIKNLPFDLKSTGADLKKRRRAKNAKQANRQVFNHSRQIVLSVIGLTALVVILAALFSAIATPETIVKHKIESLARDYYETYYYENVLAYAPTDKTLEEIMTRYAEHGFAPTSLSQLLLFDGQRHASVATTLTSYCSENSTTVTFYPVAPYGRSDYRADYKYSCSF